jgi:hypothetical protein
VATCPRSHATWRGHATRLKCKSVPVDKILVGGLGSPFTFIFGPSLHVTCMPYRVNVAYFCARIERVPHCGCGSQVTRFYLASHPLSLPTPF